MDIPQKYAETSFMTTVAMGNQNQKSPFRVLLAKNLHCITTMHTVTIDHIVCDSWNRIKPSKKKFILVRKKKKFGLKLLFFVVFVDLDHLYLFGGLAR
jgi:hypothetical protein